MTSTLSRPRPAPAPSPPPTRRWRHLPLAVLLAATAALYLWGLSASGWANAFYAAAAQAGGQSWSAWFFGASDAAGGITVDKAPGALWPIGLAVRLFGLSSWSVLVPQALMGVGAVALLHAAVRRVAGPGAGLVAGAALALTPVAVLMFRFDNPDAMLVLVLTGAAYSLTRAVEQGRTRWLVLVGLLVGYGFLTKMLQAFLVLPAFSAVWLLAAPLAWWPRIRALLVAGAALLVSAGWWVLVVELWPAADRPWIGGSQGDSVLELVFGYNGFGRLTGDEVGSVGGGAGGRAGGWGETGLLRLFGSEMGREASWLLPAALVLLGVLLWWTRRAPRTDPLRAATVLWGGWLLVTGLTFSLMAGIVHSYYTVALAPAVAALVGIGGATLWRDRASAAARWWLAAAVAATAMWAYALLPAAWLGWLRPAMLVVGLGAALALLGVHRMPRVLATGVLTAALLAGAGGTTAWALGTAATPHTGAIPSSGPEDYASGPGGGRGGPGGMRGPWAGSGAGAPGGASGPAGTVTGGAVGAPGAAGGGAAAGSAGTGGSAGAPGAATAGGPGGRWAGGGPTRGPGGAGGPGGILSAPTPSSQVTGLIAADADDFTWAAATVSSMQAAGYQLASGAPVLAVGGFNGTDPYPTLAQFRQMVAQHRIHWFIGSAGSDMISTASGGSDDARLIAEWVAATFPARTVDGVTLHDLSAS
ncbi:glycosyltransferase family 39 protein [Pseudonocardia sp. DR1-2]|uniref:glycosyltransferase family 39 protein n=1 Tax=Pseudonocardia sp. DR1-2 TaxID=2951168 RepID=UPI0020444128|nr:glycosyltransferase family 39 protein [Pseudonocardia sp. DR1-2]MCM3849505.1 glycosyltransferase family 39 protein [Pseudonocardia sp. DR1-2]